MHCVATYCRSTGNRCGISYWIFLQINW